MPTIRRAWTRSPVLVVALVAAAVVALALIDGDVLVDVLRVLVSAAGTEHDRTAPMPPPGHPLE